MSALCATKIAATVFSYSSGGAGGIFAPSLFIGGTLGGAVGTLDRTLLGHLDAPIGAFALVGMGAVFSGIIRAPMTSVLIIIEMTSGYSLILPLMIANMTAYGIARHLRPKPIYDALLEQDGIDLHEHRSATLDELKLEPFVDHGPFATLSPSLTATEVTRITQSGKARDVYPVLDGSRKLVGIITTEELRLLSADPELQLLTTASDLMRPPKSVRATDYMRSALDAMVSIGCQQVPVTDDAGCFVGMVDEMHLAQAYLRAQRRPAPEAESAAGESS